MDCKLVCPHPPSSVKIKTLKILLNRAPHIDDLGSVLVSKILIAMIMNLWVVVMVEYFVNNGDFGGTGRGLLISLPKILLAESKGCACFVLQQDFIAFFLGSTILFSE